MNDFSPETGFITHLVSKVFRVIIGLLFCFNYTACDYLETQKELNKISRLLKGYDKEYIYLLDSTQILMNDIFEYSHFSEILRDRVKLVTIIDNLDCLKCYYTKFYSLTKLSEKLKNHEHVVPIVVICGSYKYFWEVVYPEIDYSLPLIFDQECIFKVKNEFPDIEEFSTMLLDRNNKLLLVGDPTENDKIEKLYFNKISELK